MVVSNQEIHLFRSATHVSCSHNTRDDSVMWDGGGLFGRELSEACEWRVTRIKESELSEMKHVLLVFR